MRYLRYLLLWFGATLLLVGLTLAIAMLYFRVSLARLVMQQVEAQTGLRVLSINAYVQFAPRLTVQFEHAEVLDHGRSIGRLEKLKLLFSYTALLRRSGLPLYRIVLDHPEFHLPSSVQEPFLPRLDAAAAQLLEQSLATLSRATRHLDVIAATVLGADNEPLLEGLNVEAYQRLLSGTRWRLNFDSTWVGTPLKHAHLAGTVNLGARKAAPGTPIAQGELWFWSVSLDGLPLFPGLESRGQLQGSLSLTLRDDGTAVGDSAIKIIAAGLAGQRLVAATPPLDLTFDTVLDSSPERLALRKIELWQGRQIVLAGDGYLAQPYSPNPTLALRLGGITLNASQLRKALSSLREPPRWMATYAARLRSGELRVNQVALDSTLDELKAASPRLAKRLNLDATLEALSFALPPDLQLPPVEKLDATMLMRQSVLTISQGSAILGNSHLTGFDARVDFSRGLENPSYSTKLSGDLDLGSLYSQSAALTKAIPAAVRGQLQRLAGTAGFELKASGRSSASQWELPSDYRMTVEPRHVDVALKIGGPGFALVAGKAYLTPGLIALDQITAMPPSGKVVLDGSLKLNQATLKIENLTVRIEQLPAEQWMHLILDPGDLSAQGPVTGTAVVTGDGVQPSRYRIDGNLRLGPGQVQFGFLRSPVITQLATLKLAGGGAQLSLLGSKLEGSRLDLTLGVADLRSPKMRIDAWAENLDLESMKFIRLPWTAKSQSNFFGNSRAFGHIEARQARIARLSIADLKFDFTRDADWHVFNCAGRIFNGAISMDLFGREPDDWIHIKSRLTDVDLGPLINMADGTSPPPIVGKLDADADVWADTNADFFETLAGTLWFSATHGTLSRFKLLSRVLSLIDLSQWLTARIPDPRVAGLPFDTLRATFAGKNGVFYTNDLLLNGPAMTVSAAGNVNAAQGMLDMQLGLRPFSTVEKVVKEIPILGRGFVSKESSILAAYFRARGPIRDPSVTPAPVTSIAEIIKRTLGLPINVIRPNTIQ